MGDLLLPEGWPNSAFFGLHFSSYNCAVALAAASSVIFAFSAAVLFLQRLGVTKGSSAAASFLGAKKAHVSSSDPDDPSKPTVRILYGTQTGTAERFAKQLGKEIKQKYGDGTKVDVVDVENYKAEDRMRKEKLLVLCMATYGDGEPTDNAANFYKWLLKEAELVDGGEKEPFLQGMSYAVFGLGNKQYEHFNAVGKKVFKSLGIMGASALIRRGDGDDDGCIDEEFEKWCAELQAMLDSRPDLVGAVQDQALDESLRSVAAYDAEILLSGAQQAPAFPAAGSGLDAHHPYIARVSCVRELYGPGAERSCVHVEVDLSSSRLAYEHGDHIGIYAQNSKAVVDAVAKLLGHPDPDSVLITLRKPSSPSSATASLAPPPFVGPLSLRLALGFFADVLSSPHREGLRALAAFATDPVEAQRLRMMAVTEGKDEYASYITKPRRSLLEVLQDFPSCNPVPLGAFFASLAPRLQPRFYSISSSPALHPRTAHVTAAVVRELMPSGRLHEGVASTWMQRCLHGSGGKGQREATGAPVPVFVRRSHFKLPKDPSVPIIMVGPGTGLAPFRGFLQERSALQKSGAGSVG